MIHRRAVRIVSLAASFTVALGALVAGTAPVAEAKPTFTITKVVTGLTVPWDLTWVGGVMLFDERAGRLWSKTGSASPKRVQIALPAIWTSSEGGLLGLVADPDADNNKLFYTCQSTKSGNVAQDVRVLRWRLDDATHASPDGDPVVTGLPVGSGRHNGCRLRFGPDGKLYVGTGDAAKTENAQSLTSLGGKVLRVNADVRSPPTTRSTPKGATRGTSGPTATAMSRAWPFGQGPTSSGTPSTAPSATTRSTSTSRARTTAGSRVRATTSPSR